MRGTKAKADNPVTLSDEVLAITGANPDGSLSDLSKVVFYSKYSRYREDVKRREYYAETAQRATEYNVNLAMAYAEEKGLNLDEFRRFHADELAELYLHQYLCKMSLSGRTLYVGGTIPSYESPISNFNCSFMVMDEWRKLGELMYLGMVGSGIGFRILKEDVARIEPLKLKEWKIKHKTYKPVKAENRKQRSFISMNDSNVVKITIGDSKEGWRESIDLLFDLLTNDIKDVDTIEFNYNNVRPAGEKLKRFGGRAGGPQTLKKMFDTFHKILNGKLDKDYPQMVDGKPEPLHMLDLANAIGKNIVSGDVRSIAEIALLDANDTATIEAKSTIFDKEHLNHRYVSNNSIFYLTKPTRERLEWQFEQIKFNGEPCAVNAELGSKRRPNFKGVNPCVEILLDDRGLCNLTTVNWMAFVEKNENGELGLDLEGAMRAFAMATRAGIRMTLPKLELPEWDLIQQRDRLIGVSFTGWQDMVDAVDIDTEQQKRILDIMKRVVNEASKHYCEFLGVNEPLLKTCIKPEGTISQLFGGVSSGLHVSHAPSFIRRIRSATKDPISKAIFEHKGWAMHAEISDGSQHAQIREVMQYVPHLVHLETIENDGQTVDAIKPNVYTHKNGRIHVKFAIAKKVPQSAGQIISVLKTYYDNEVFNISVEEDLRWYNVSYEAKAKDFDSVFGKSNKVVTDFPNKTTAKRTKANFSAIEQLETYKMCLHHYTDHNPSNTISVRENEWDGVIDWVDKNWDDLLAVSFLSLYDTPYPLSPFEEVTEEVVDAMKEEMEDFDVQKMWKFDLGGDMEIVEGSCEGGFCPVR